MVFGAEEGHGGPPYVSTEDQRDGGSVGWLLKREAPAQSVALLLSCVKNAAYGGTELKRQPTALAERAHRVQLCFMPH